MKVVVTGGAGFIGSHVVDELVQNHHVTCIDNLSTGSTDNIKHHLGNPNFTFVNADIMNADFMSHLCAGADRIYHLAVQCVRLSISHPELVHDVNATGTLNMLRAARKNNVGKFIYISSSEIYGHAQQVPMPETHPTEPTTVYGASKLVGEFYTKAYTRTYGMNTLVLRPFNSYGPRAHFEGAYGEVIPKFAVRIKNGKAPMIFGDGNQTRDFMYVKDTARGIVQASDASGISGEVINLAYGEEVSIKNIAQYVLEGLNSDLQPEFHPDRPGDIRRLYADATKAKQMFGFNPQVDIKSGIAKYLAWLETQNVDASKEVEFNWK